MVTTTILILTSGALVQGFFGFGFGALVVALLTIELSTKDAVAQLVSIAPVSTFASAFIQRKEIAYRGVLPLAFGTLLFFPLGVWLLFIAPERALHVALGSVVVVAALMQLFPGKLQLLPPGPVGGTVASALSGLFGGAIGVPGLTMTAYIYGKEKNPNVARASLQFFFMFTTIIGFLTHAVAGTVTWQTLRVAGFAVIPVIAALYGGVSLARGTDPGKLRYYYAAGLLLLGGYTILRTLI